MATQLAVTDSLIRAGAFPGFRARRGLRGGFRAARNRDIGWKAPRPAHSLRQEQERQRWLVALLPLVKQIAFQMRAHLPAHIEVDDLVGAGMLGLVDAVAKFDASKRVKLESYAHHRIRGGMLDGLRALDPVSRDMRKKNKKVERAYRELEGKLGRPASDEEISGALGISLKRWHRTLQELQNVGFDGSARIGSVGLARMMSAIDVSELASTQEDPFEACFRREQRDILNRALSRLPERERLIVRLYYQQDRTMKEIAAHLNVDESRISQLHAAALLRLKTRVQALLRPPCPVLQTAPVCASAAA